jgi:hypothetical protein
MINIEVHRPRSMTGFTWSFPGMLFPFKQTKIEDMKYLLLIFLIACSEKEEKQTKIVITGIEQEGDHCIYSVQTVSPYQPYGRQKIEDLCGKYQVGEEVIVGM